MRQRAETVGYWLYTGHLLTLFGIAASNILLGLTILWTLYHRIVHPGSLASPWRRAAPVLLPAGLAAGLFTASALASLEPEVSRPELRDLISWATLLLAPMLVRGEAATRRLAQLVLATTALLALQGIGQYYLTDYGPLHQRIIGLFSHYQTFAGILLLGLLLGAARLAAGHLDRWTGLATALIAWCLLLTLTRGAWVAAAVTLSAFGAIHTLRALRARRWDRRPAVAAGAVVVVLIAAIALGPASWRERFGSIADLGDVSNYDRLCMVEAGGYMVAERPVFGLGPEVVEALYPIYRHPTAPRATVPHLHNTFVQRAAELGLPFLAVLLWLFVAVFHQALLRYRREGGLAGQRADLYLAAMLATVGFAIAGLFEDNWRDTEVRRLLLFFFAIPFCLGPAPASRSLSPCETRSETHSAEDIP